jgi:hypothetical protein
MIVIELHSTKIQAIEIFILLFLFGVCENVRQLMSKVEVYFSKT